MTPVTHDIPYEVQRALYAYRDAHRTAQARQEHRAESTILVSLDGPRVRLDEEVRRWASETTVSVGGDTQ